MYKGKDVLVVFDDLTKHAWAYRELSLLLERPPGREAYPGDIFYIHSQLMERAGKLRKELGGGSMTFLPIVETIQGDISGFIPTNLISMTDGQIYLNTTLFSEGFKPAVELGLSVSRIGNKVQPPLIRQLTQKLRLEYIQYGELVKTSKLKSGISKEIRRRLDHGEKLRQIFIQDKNQPSPFTEQILLFYAFKTGVLDTLSFQECENFKKGIFDVFMAIAQLVPVGHLVFIAMNGMALDAGHVVQGMLRTSPVHSLAIGMATGTDSRSLGGF